MEDLHNKRAKMSTEEIIKEMQESTEKIKKEYNTKLKRPVPLAKSSHDSSDKYLLYRLGGLTGTEIGEMMGVDYSTVSQRRNRLREKRKGAKNLSALLGKTEANLS